MLCERKLRARKVDKRQTGCFDIISSGTCRGTLVEIGKYGYACDTCERYSVICQRCNTSFKSAKVHFTDKETGKWNDCYRDDKNQPIRQLMATFKKP